MGWINYDFATKEERRRFQSESSQRSESCFDGKKLTFEIFWPRFESLNEKIFTSATFLWQRISLSLFRSLSLSLSLKLTRSHTHTFTHTHTCSYGSTLEHIHTPTHAHKFISPLPCTNALKHTLFLSSFLLSLNSHSLNHFVSPLLLLNISICFSFFSIIKFFLHWSFLSFWLKCDNQKTN